MWHSLTQNLSVINNKNCNFLEKLLIGEAKSKSKTEFSLSFKSQWVVTIKLQEIDELLKVHTFILFEVYILYLLTALKGVCKKIFSDFYAFQLTLLTVPIEES